MNKVTGVVGEVMKKIAVILLMITMLLVACGAVNVDAQKSAAGIEYSIVEIEGMPCLTTRTDTNSVYTVISVTCDWSKWEGELPQ